MSVDEVLEKLIRDVEASVHALYRGDVRQNTQRVKSGTLRNSARQSLTPFLSEGGGSEPASSAALSTLTQDEVIAATRCVIAWQAMGGANSASPQSNCIPAAREMAPTWGEREKARLALKRVVS